MTGRRLIVPLFLLVIVVGASYAYYQSRHVAGPLTGLPVSPGAAQNRAVAVILDNYSPDARPQSGLPSASLVFETLAEGGITRLLAIYDVEDAAKIGPVRSARVYFNAWVAGFGAIFGHDGGNVDALQELRHLPSIYNIDADRSHGPFYRTSDRVAPHNEYTSTTVLRSFAAAAGGSTTGPPPAFAHRGDAPIGSRPIHLTITIDFSSTDYRVTWAYDRASNRFLRSVGGVPQIDTVTGKQIAAKNVAIMRTEESAAYDPFTPGSIHLRTEGTGNLTVYRDGVSVAGTWSKTTPESALTLLDPSGSPLPLDRGITWIEVVPGGTTVTTQ